MQQKLLAVYVKMQHLKSVLIRDERGQDLIEYALVASLIALAATAGMKSVATSLGTAFTGVGTKLTTYTS